MSENQGTGPETTVATVGIRADGCFADVTDYMRGVSQLRARYQPGQQHPSYSVPATVTVRIGQAAWTLTPEVWAAVNDAVQQVLPVGVVPA